MKVMIGLGNPGEKYKNTKHNAGFIFLDKVIEEKCLRWENNKKLKAEIAKDGRTIYAKPQTFMNDSGRSVAAILSYYKLMPKRLGMIKEKNADLSESLTIIHDDIDIPLGEYKISKNSRSAGHRGVESIIQNLKTKNFQRIRIGIYNKERGNVPTIKAVLEKFNQEERDILEKTIKNMDLPT